MNAKQTLMHAIAGILTSTLTFAQTLPIDTSATGDYELNWQDEFDYPDEDLDDNWFSQNGPSGGYVLCSRWRENSVVSNGILEIKAIKEDRGGQEWTCGNLWSKKNFKYGYYEAKYKYAGATGTNNSFWLYPYSGTEAGQPAYELDINEGQYPNVIKTNIHDWTNDVHPPQERYYAGETVEPQNGYTHELESSINTTKIRFSSTSTPHFHIGEFRVYAPNSNGYPSDPVSETADTDVAGLVNHSRDVATTFEASGQYVAGDGRSTDPENVADGEVAAAGKSWIAQADGNKWLEITFSESKEVGCIQFTNGWTDGSNWYSLITNYKIEYWDGANWVEIDSFDTSGDTDLSAEYHTYGLLWTSDEHKFYFDGELIRTEANTNNHGKTKILLSLAILSDNIGGPVTDDIDGTSMKFDYVRYYIDKSDQSPSDNLEATVNKISTYPNPVINTLNFSEDWTGSSCKIYNVHGSLLLKENLSNDKSLDVSTLPKGMYIFTIEENNKINTGKFIKQ